jgi:dTDP-glucose 4,6-dehydratase
MRVLLTGAGGFAGHHVLEHLLVTTDWDVVCTDSFRHRGKTDRVAEVLEGHDVWRTRTRVITHDLTVPFSAQAQNRIGHIDYVIAMASESHVDRSIDDPVPFVQNNVNVALSTLELCRWLQPRAVLWMSTDEVYGPEVKIDGKLVPHKEWAPIIPSNPYSASKAAQEAIAISWWRTYGVPVVIINGMNLIGERQDPEKFLPMLIRKISTGGTIQIHGHRGDVGSRHYLHCRNLADGMLHILGMRAPACYPAHSVRQTTLFGQAWMRTEPDRWNIVGDRTDNLTLAHMVAEIIGKPLHYQLVDFHSARPGHDPHYGLDPAKLAEAGWTPPVDFRESLERTVNWALKHQEWLR